MQRLLCLLAVFSFASTHANAQSDVPYFEVIEGDSVRMFIDATILGSSVTRLTGKECASGYRLTRISLAGMFDGKFQDYLNRINYGSTLMAEGSYRDGKKEGPFKWYYMDGKPMYEGNYSNDNPSGEWKCYNSKGELIMLLQFKEGSEPLINYMLDDKTKVVLVKDGNGEARFKLMYGEYPYAVSGRIKAGLPDGEWYGEADIAFQGTTQTKRLIRRETYKEGVMVAGTKIQSGRMTNICCNPELTAVFPFGPVFDILDLEGFPIEPCAQVTMIPSTTLAPPAPRSAEPVSDLLNFQSSLRSIIRNKYRGREVGEGYNLTMPGTEENQLVMHFKTNENGRPVMTRQVSAYGRDFYYPIKRALETLTKWQPNQEKLVLTVYIRMSLYNYGYRYNFSLN